MNWFGNPWQLTAACYAWACTVVYLTDPLALPRAVAGKHRIERSSLRAVIETLARLPIIRDFLASHLCRAGHAELLHHLHGHLARQVHLHP